MPALTPELKEAWDTDGWCTVPGVIPPAELAAAQEAMHHYFPNPAEMAEKGGTAAGEWHTWEDRKSTRLNSSHLARSRMPSSA